MGILFPICHSFSGVRWLLEINDHKFVYFYLDAIAFTNLILGFSLTDLLNNFHWAGKELWHCVSCQDGFENLFNIFCSPGIFLWTHNSLAKKCLLSLLTKEDMDLTELKWLAQYSTTIKNQTQDISMGILIQKADFFLLHTILPSSSLSSTGDKTQRWKTWEI